MRGPADAVVLVTVACALRSAPTPCPRPIGPAVRACATSRCAGLSGCIGDPRARPRVWRSTRARRRARRAASARGPRRPRSVGAWPPGGPTTPTLARRANPPRLAGTAVADRGVPPNDGATRYTRVARGGAGCPHCPCWPPRGGAAPLAAAVAPCARPRPARGWPRWPGRPVGGLRSSAYTDGPRGQGPWSGASPPRRVKLHTQAATSNRPTDHGRDGQPQTGCSTPAPPPRPLQTLLLSLGAAAARRVGRGGGWRGLAGRRPPQQTGTVASSARGAPLVTAARDGHRRCGSRCRAAQGGGLRRGREEGVSKTQRPFFRRGSVARCAVSV